MYYLYFSANTVSLVPVMTLSTQEANFVGLFAETLLFGILLVAAGYCLRLLLFQPDRLVLRKAQDIKRWAVGVIVFMTVVSAMDLALNLRLNMEAFLWTSSGEAAADLLNDNASWLNVTRFMLYISEVLVADGILIFRLFVVYGRRWRLNIILLSLFLPAGIAIAVTVVILGAARNSFGDATSDFINAGLLGADILLNGYTTSLIIYKLWKTRAATRDISINPDKWLILIRIIIESGTIYMASVVTTLISEPLGNIGVTLGDVVGQVIAIATVLLILRTHDMLRRVPVAYELSGLSLPPAAQAALAVSLPGTYVASISSPVVPMEEVIVLDNGVQKAAVGKTALSIQTSSVTQLPYDSSVSSDSISNGAVRQISSYSQC